MGLTKKDAKIIKEALKPEFEGIHKKFDELDSSIDKRFKAQGIAMKHEIRSSNIQLRKSMSTMVKEAIDLIHQTHPTRDEVDSQIDDLRDEFKSSVNLLQDK